MDLTTKHHDGFCFTRKADGTLYAIVLDAQDGDSMPASVTLPAALAAGGRTITLVGHRGAPLAVTVGTDGLAVVELPAAAPANPPCSDAWALRIQPHLASDQRNQLRPASGDHR